MMSETVKLGIIICDRYQRCAGGKCFRALKKREGAFSLYTGKSVDLIGYTTCDGCPGGNIEYAVEEMKSNGVDRIHLATGLIVGYPPCPYIEYFQDFIQTKYDIPVQFGTHPIPEKYFQMHQKLGTWDNSRWSDIIGSILVDEKIRISYN
jgi:predicted metal-binding protein